MPRPEKVAAVAEIKERIEGAKAVFLAEYAGLSVKDQQDLRRKLREQGAEFKVVKMTLARRAIAGLEIEGFEELLVGPTGITFADTDAVSAAKALKEFASSHDVFAVKGGLLGADFLTAERIAALAEIAPRGELLAMLAGAMKAPLTAMAGLLAALPRQTATVLQQLLEKKESGEFAPASAEKAAGATAAEVDEAEAEVEPPSADEGDVTAEADAVATAANDEAAVEPDSAASAADDTVSEEAAAGAASSDEDDEAATTDDTVSEEAAAAAAPSDEDNGAAAADDDDDAGEVETPTASVDEDSDPEPDEEEPAAAAEEEE